MARRWLLWAMCEAQALGTMPAIPTTIAKEPAMASIPTRTRPTWAQLALSGGAAAGALAAFVLLLVLLPEAGHAAPPERRTLEIRIDTQRDAAMVRGAETGRSRSTQQWLLRATLSTDGTPSSSNPLDPADSGRAYAAARQRSQRVQQAVARAGQAQPVAAGMADMAAMQARAQQIQARCGSDRDCLMREAMAMSAAQVGGDRPDVSARLGAYGAELRRCEASTPAGAAREVCIADARRRAGGGDEVAEEAVETPYLHFSGPADCALEVHTRIDRRTEGTYPDVQGPVPFTNHFQADQTEGQTVLCPQLVAVLDTRNGRLWAHVLPAMQPVAGHLTRQDGSRPATQVEERASPSWDEADTWLADRLHRLSAAGEDRVQLPAGAGGHRDGQMSMRLRWRFSAS